MNTNIREELIYCFEQTRKRSMDEFPDQVSGSIEKTVISDHFSFNHSAFEKRDLNVVINTNSSVCSASLYKDKKIAILNFASAYRPGGGVTTGARAQEESLCRCSTLYEILTSEKCITQYYQKNRNESSEYGSDRIIYSPGIVFFNTDDQDIPKAIEPFVADVITCAAPNLRNKNCDSAQFEKIIYKRYENIFKAACVNKVEILILGAIGCGVFKNPVSIVARVMAELCKEYPYFENIIFPIYRSVEMSNSFKEEFDKIIRQ